MCADEMETMVVAQTGPFTIRLMSPHSTNGGVGWRQHLTKDLGPIDQRNVDIKRHYHLSCTS